MALSAMLDPLPKAPTGFRGFDDMSRGGLPEGRVCVIAGGPGAGKTLFALQALVNRIRATGRPGVFVSFEENPDSIARNFAGFGWGLEELLNTEQLLLVDGRWRLESERSGDFDIAGLLAAVEGVVDHRHACFVVFDGIDALLTMLSDSTHTRRELRRLQDWNERLHVTTIVSIKSRGLPGQAFEPHRLEDIVTYMADCVVVLEHTTVDGISSRGIYIQKYRGSEHMQNRVPYVIGPGGIEVETITLSSSGIGVSTERLPTGVADLDTMLRGGLYRGSTTLMSGAPGTAKTTLAARFAQTACERGERTLVASFDEAPEEVVRNVASVGVHLQPLLDEGVLRMEGFVARTASADLLTSRILSLLEVFRPRHLVIDPVSALSASGSEHLAHNAVRRIIQHCKTAGITVVLTSLLDNVVEDVELSKAHVSTLADNWLHLSYVVRGGERNRALTIVKSRGTGHSNQVRELLLGSDGIRLKEVYTEEGEVLMGALRWQHEERSRRRRREEVLAARQRRQQARREMEDLEMRLTQLQRQLEEKREDLEILEDENEGAESRETLWHDTMSDIRRAEGSRPPDAGAGTDGDDEGWR